LREWFGRAATFFGIKRCARKSLSTASSLNSRAKPLIVRADGLMRTLAISQKIAGDRKPRHADM